MERDGIWPLLKRPLDPLENGLEEGKYRIREATAETQGRITARTEDGSGTGEKQKDLRFVMCQWIWYQGEGKERKMTLFLYLNHSKDSVGIYSVRDDTVPGK